MLGPTEKLSSVLDFQITCFLRTKQYIFSQFVGRSVLKKHDIWNSNQFRSKLMYIDVRRKFIVPIVCDCNRNQTVLEYREQIWQSVSSGSGKQSVYTLWSATEQLYCLSCDIFTKLQDLPQTQRN